jgi:hypothetical protein
MLTLLQGKLLKHELEAAAAVAVAAAADPSVPDAQPVLTLGIDPRMHLHLPTAVVAWRLKLQCCTSMERASM